MIDGWIFAGADAEAWVAKSVQKVIEESAKKRKKEKRNNTVNEKIKSRKLIDLRSIEIY